jgi:hypothetical protein
MYLVRTVQHPDLPKRIDADFYEYEGCVYIVFYKRIMQLSPPQWPNKPISTKTLVKLFRVSDIITVEEDK